MPYSSHGTLGTRLALHNCPTSRQRIKKVFPEDWKEACSSLKPKAISEHLECPLSVGNTIGIKRNERLSLEG
jgi:hypothetical protein